MQNKARNISFARNGTDTTGLTNQSWLTEKQMGKSKTFAEEDAVEYPQKLKKQLKKKGIKSIIVDENKLTQHPAYLNKYWLKTTYISSQKSPEDNGWILTITNMFYDPRTKKDFEVYLPLNSSLFELIE
ncbi:MAG TPA: hypothetical protein VIN08_09315 [Ohtaekwangia sp.]|uniref:hypothetical protein n=1 Tax=Ohtaekwangia sp. TaxID=2066019 RepID=UPI002F92707C